MLAILNRLALILLTAVFLLLTFGAITYQIQPPLRWLAYGAAALAGGAVYLAGRRRGWLVLVLAAIAVGGWYQTIQPSNDRIWAEDVSRGVTARLEGDLVHLSDLRDFDWQSRDDATPHWREVTVDLSKLQSVDLFNSVWASPLIAHTLISFGFEDGRHIVFSAEIRREKGEVFSTYGGFFRQFELVLIAATEPDIIRLRTNERREDVSLFPIKATPDQARELFLRYITRANQLQDQPEFYNTLTSNCTTIIWELAHAVDGELPFDWRILVSGKLPEYLRDRELLFTEAPIATIREEARITPRALAEDLRGPAYSPMIRAGEVRKLMPQGE